MNQAIIDRSNDIRWTDGKIPVDQLIWNSGMEKMPAEYVNMEIPGLESGTYITRNSFISNSKSMLYSNQPTDLPGYKSANIFLYENDYMIGHGAVTLENLENPFLNSGSVNRNKVMAVTDKKIYLVYFNSKNHNHNEIQIWEKEKEAIWKPWLVNIYSMNSLGFTEANQFNYTYCDLISFRECGAGEFQLLCADISSREKLYKIKFKAQETENWLKYDGNDSMKYPYSYGRLIDYYEFNGTNYYLVSETGTQIASLYSSTSQDGPFVFERKYLGDFDLSDMTSWSFQNINKIFQYENNIYAILGGSLYNLLNNPNGVYVEPVLKVATCYDNSEGRVYGKVNNYPGYYDLKKLKSEYLLNSVYVKGYTAICPWNQKYVLLEESISKLYLSNANDQPTPLIDEKYNTHCYDGLQIRYYTTVINPTIYVDKETFMTRYYVFTKNEKRAPKVPQFGNRNVLNPSFTYIKVEEKTGNNEEGNS